MRDVVSSLPIVSVLMPVHNGGEYLQESVTSILSQTLFDIELIIIDDGSTDASLLMLQGFADIDPRVRVFSREQRGLIATLNEGISLARAEWIARMDADDVALPGRISSQLEQLRRTGADFCGGAVECFGKWKSVWRYPESHLACEVVMLFNSPFAHPAVMARRSALLDLSYDSQYLHAEDYDCWQRAWAAGYKLTNVPTVVLRYRVHAQQISSKHRDQLHDTADHVRSRHWAALLPEFGPIEIEQAVTVTSHQKGKSVWLVPAFCQLLGRYSGEARQILLFNVYRTFCGVAGCDIGTPWNWLRILKGSHVAVGGRNLLRFGVLVGISLLRLNVDGVVFRRLQRLRAVAFSSVRNRQP